MGYASKQGRARINPSAPQAAGVCDRCGFVHNHADLRWQYDWRGASLANLRLLVCPTCYDAPQQQLRAIVLPADPVPVQNPRIQNFVEAESDYRTTSGQNTTAPFVGIPVPGNDRRITENDEYRVTQEVGQTASRTNYQPGLQQGAIMPLQNQTAYAVTLPVSAMTANSTATITVDCSASHGLSNGDQVSVAGSGLTLTDGFYTVAVTSPTQFTYMVNSAVLSGTALLLNSTLIKTANVGLPLDMTDIPQTGSL